jgi:hypothetical protein
MAGLLPPFPWATTLRRPGEIFGFCQKVAEFLRAVSRLEILGGHFVEAEFVATDIALVRHALGRPYTGAIVVASSDPSVTPTVTAVSVGAAVQLDLPVTEAVALGAPSAFTATLLVWVF